MMNRQQIILVVASVAAVVLLYRLPRVVVENETDEKASPVQSHDFSIKPEDENRFASLRQQLNVSSDFKKSINFADSLAQLSLKYQMVDSAAKYAQVIQELDSSAEMLLKSAMIYYEASQLSVKPEQGRELAAEARRELEILLEKDPQNNSLKCKLAMTIITTENPMAGVQVLREVLDSDPENREALLDLGLLAIRSNQYDRAVERFENLLEINPDDYEALFYYGVSLAESGNSEKAKTAFEELMSKEDADPALKATASTYIKEL